MTLLTLNAVFAAAFMMAGVNAARRGWPFLLHGWRLIGLHGRAPDARWQVEHRRGLTDGGRFFVGGLLWLGASLIAFVGGVYFSFQVFTLLLA